jgi:hypothetical protein
MKCLLSSKHCTEHPETKLSKILTNSQNNINPEQRAHSRCVTNFLNCIGMLECPKLSPDSSGTISIVNKQDGLK